MNPKQSHLTKDKIISKEERQRRKSKGRKKREGRKYKTKTPRQKLQVMCIQSGLSTEGTTQDLKNRLINFFDGLIKFYKKEGAPICYGKGHIEMICVDCVLQDDCKTMIKNIKNVYRLEKLIEIKRRLK